MTQSFKGIFQCANSSFRSDFANCSAACVLEYEQAHCYSYLQLKEEMS